MAAETSTEVGEDASKDSPSGELVEYVDAELFGGSTDSLERFTARKQALAHPVRYAILYHLRAAGDESERVPRTELKRLLDRENNALQTHVRPLLSANLLAEVPAPDGVDGRQTFYRITNLGERAIRSDLWTIEGELPE